MAHFDTPLQPGTVTPDERAEALRPAIVAAIGTVYDPEIPVSIWELGLVYDIAIRNGRDVDVTMTQSPPPEGQMVILDAFADCMRRTMDLNMSLVERQLRDASETADPPPALKMDNDPGGGIPQEPTQGA